MLQNQIPYKIVSDRLIIRCYEPADVWMLNESVNRSQAHLLPYMSWAVDGPFDLQHHVNYISTTRSRFDRDEDYTMGIFLKDSGLFIGGGGLHKRVGPNAIEIGYWIDVNYIKNAYATELTKALAKVAFDILGIQRVVITIHEKNEWSKKIPINLGWKYEGTERRKFTDYLGMVHDIESYSMFADEYRQGDLPNTFIQATDFLNREIILATNF